MLVRLSGVEVSRNNILKLSPYNCEGFLITFTLMKKVLPLFFIFLLACNQQNKKINTRIIKVVAAQGYAIPKDSIETPKIVYVDQSKLIKIPAGKPSVVTTNSNIHMVGAPKIILADNPRVCTPGQDTFLLPKKVKAIGKIILSGIPEITIAKDMAIKDQNSQNFSTYSKLQGLKQSTVMSILEDNSGNLWFGTYGGVVKFNGKFFTTFTDKEGLVNNNLRSILEDKNGNLWFGTHGGLSKYDGKTFTNFTDKDGLSNNIVSSILEDTNGNLWFGTEGGGIIKYDGKLFTTFTDKEGLANNVVRSILEDKKGNLWFTTHGGVSKYDGKSFTTFTDKEGLANNAVSSISLDEKGNLWFGTSDGVSIFDGKHFTTFTDKEGLANKNILSILKDKSGNLWLGTNGGGVTKYDGKSFTSFADKEGLANNSIWSMLEDKSGNLWFGSQSGVSKYDGKFFTSFTDKEGLTNNSVRGILQDKKGNLWFGTYGGGISKYDGKSFATFTKKEGLPHHWIMSILEDRKGNLWFGSYGEGVFRYDGKSFTTFKDKRGLTSNQVMSLIEDKSGNIWFGTYGGGVSKYDGKSFTTFTDEEGLANNTVMSMLEDKSGNFWFGTYGGGVSKYDGKSFTTFSDKEGLASNTVLSILEDRRGDLWFGSDGGGVSKYDGNFFTHFTTKEGLANNTVTSILEDKGGNLWFGTRYGLSKLSNFKIIEIHDKVKTGKVKDDDVIFKNYTYEDGFLGIGCNGNSICEAKDGTIWIGTNDKLTVMHPEGIQPDTIPPNIQLTTIELFNENIPWGNIFINEESHSQAKDTTLTLGNGVNVSDFEFDGFTRWYNLPVNLSLAYNNNYLMFNFIGITMSQPKNVRYKYKLEGIDDNWSAITSRTEASYGNLPHGAYTFKVKAMNSEGYWSVPFEYKFIIRPPFWHTWWFRVLIGLLVVNAIWFYIKMREKKLVSEKEKLEKTVEERTDELVQQNAAVEHQKVIIEEKHKEITDSINYAERIQRSFLATKELLDDNLKNHFVFFKPKDVVSGDFYWGANTGSANNKKFLLCTADSTGHGVPGAIMSLLNITSLESATKQGFTHPADILNVTRKTIIERLKNDGSEIGGKDGMDCSLVSFDFANYAHRSCCVCQSTV